jgi:hypothetical protein
MLQMVSSPLELTRDRQSDQRSASSRRSHSEGSLVEAGRLIDQLATAEDSQAARATDAPRISTVAAYRA